MSARGRTPQAGNRRRFVMAAWALSICGLARAGEPAPSTPVSDAVEELGEVVVSADEPTRKLADMIPWLRRLPGQYTYSGFIDVEGEADAGDRREVRGSGVCVGFGVAPGVQCEIHVRWPEITGPSGEDLATTVPSLNPAMILYGLDPDARGIHYMQVDDQGRAEGSIGYVYGNTAVFRAPCADSPDNCVRVTRITAAPDADVLNMQVDTELDFRLAVRLRVEMRRLPGTGAMEQAQDK